MALHNKGQGRAPLTLHSPRYSILFIMFFAVLLVGKVYAGSLVDGTRVNAAEGDGKMADAKMALRQKQFGRAVSILRPLATTGDAEAQYLLASFYRSGRGVKKDHTLAFDWLVKAANNNHLAAQYNLAVMYEQGWGTQSNSTQAHKWYRLAAAAGNRQAITRLKTWDSSLIDETTPLHVLAVNAIKNDDRASLAKLLNAGLKPSKEDAAGRSLLTQSILFSAESCFAMLLKRFPNLVRELDDENAALVLAITLKQEKFISPLIKAGVNVNLPDALGNYPLHTAVRLRSFKVVKQLLDAGANVTVGDREGMNPLDIAKIAGDSHIAKALGDAGARHSTQYADDYQVDRSVVVDNQWIAEQRRLLRDGHLGYVDWPLINVAAFLGKKSLVSALLANGDSAISLDSESRTAIERAIMGGHDEVLTLLFSAEDMQKHSASMMKLIEIAITHKHIGIAQWLLRQAARFKPAALIASRPLVQSIRAGEEQFAISLLAYPLVFSSEVDRGNEQQAFILAVKTNMQEVLPHFAIRDELINTQDADGRSVLWYCASDGYESICRLLIEWGADLSIADDTGQTPLMLAVKNGHISIARQLLEHGAEPSVADQRGMTALLKAAANGQAGSVALLLNKGGNVEHRDAESRTALMLASQHGFRDVVTVLVREGANIRRRDKRGLTAMDYALSAGYPELANYLESLL